jgi:hypothetical protein
MRLRGEYDAAQDRIVLTLWDGRVAGGDQLLWVTRRQWLAIAVACYRVRSAAALEGEQPVGLRRRVASVEPAVGPGAADAGSIGIQPMPDGTDDYGSGGENVKESLVSGVKLQRIPSGVRIRLTTTEAEVPFFLPLRGENFTLFIKLVERLAARAKWDLPAAVLRMKNIAPVKKEFVN